MGALLRRGAIILFLFPSKGGVGGDAGALWGKKIKTKKYMAPASGRPGAMPNRCIPITHITRGATRSQIASSVALTRARPQLRLRPPPLTALVLNSGP